MRDGVTFDAQDFEEVLDEASGMLSVNANGGTLTVGGTAGTPTTVRGLLGQLVMLFGAPLVSALFDAGDGNLVVDGKLLWADNATRPRPRWAQRHPDARLLRRHGHRRHRPARPRHRRRRPATPPPRSS